MSNYDQAIEAERLGQFDRARQILRDSIASDDPSRSLDATLMLGRLCVAGSPQLLAEGESLLASIESSQSNSSTHSTAALNLRALLERRKGNRATARQLLESSPVLESVASVEKSQCLHYLGLLANDDGDTQQAQELFFDAHEIAHACDCQTGQAEICDSIAGLLLKLGKTQTALSFCRKSLAIKEESGDRYGTAIALGTMGRILMAQAKYAEASEAFSADLEIARELDDRIGITIMLNSLANIDRLRHDLDSAQTRFDESISLNPSPINQIHVSIGMCWVQLERKDLEAAELDLATANRHLAQAPSLPELSAIVQGLAGSIAWRRGEFEAGQELLQAANDALRSQQHALDTIPFLYELRDLNTTRNRLSEAVAAMSQALDLLSESGAVRGVDDVEDWLRGVDNPRLTRVAIERHLPAPLVDQILSGELTMPKPKKQPLTVLFSDLRGFTAMSESSEPEEIVELLNEWFAEVTRAIQKHGGIVDKFIGDAVMALFGIPDPTDESAANAVLAALEMRQALNSMNRRNQVLGGHQLKIGIGIASGDAVVGFMGSHLRHSFTAIGDTVNTASRLESATRDYQNCDILIDETTQTMQQIQQAAQTESLGAASLKGKQKKVNVYRVVGSADPSHA